MSRAVAVLDAFAARERDLGVTELAARTQMPLSTTAAVVYELCDLGLLEPTEGRRYRIGVRLWELATRSPGAVGLRELALPVMRNLQATVRQHTQLGILVDQDLLILERLSADPAIINISEVGGRLPFHVTASGLVLAAFSPSETRDSLIGSRRDDPFGQLRSDPRGSTLRARLRDVRAQGYAITPGVIRPEAAGIAVPILDPVRRPLAALALVVPAAEVEGASLHGMLRHLVPSAREISQRLTAAHANVPQ